MDTKDNAATVEALIQAPVEKVWDMWTQPEHIKKWNQASDDWHTTASENDVQPGGKFSSRMEAKDGSMGFDFGGTHDEVIRHQLIRSTLGDGRKMSVEFQPEGNATQIYESFDLEKQNSAEMQRFGWQSILNNFKAYVESH